MKQVRGTESGGWLGKASLNMCSLSRDLPVSGERECREEEAACAKVEVGARHGFSSQYQPPVSPKLFLSPFFSSRLQFV